MNFNDINWRTFLNDVSKPDLLYLKRIIDEKLKGSDSMEPKRSGP